MRICSFTVVFTVMGVFLAHNILSMIYGGGIVDVSYQAAGLVALVLGAKAYQAKTEVSNGNGKPKTTSALPIDKKE
jgi:hypothetical protein